MNEANNQGEFFGAMCHWHLRRDGQITIHEIIVERSETGNGLGTQMLERLKQVEGALSIFAKCPVDLRANEWYRKNGFKLEATEIMPSGREVNHWRLKL